MKRTLLTVLVVGLISAAAGCEAFSGGSGVSAGGETTAPEAATSGPSGGRVEKCGGGTIQLNAREKKTVGLHDAARRERNLEPFCVHPALTAAARDHSEEMIRKDYFSHESYDGVPIVGRLRRHGYDTDGYRSWRVAENIAWGNYSRGSPGHIFDGWMNSESHRPNILSKEFRQIGVGTYTGEYENYENATAYAVEFGVRQR